MTYSSFSEIKTQTDQPTDTTNQATDQRTDGHEGSVGSSNSTNLIDLLTQTRREIPGPNVN